MKYIVQILREDDDYTGTSLVGSGGVSCINYNSEAPQLQVFYSEEKALKKATQLVRSSQKRVGVFKLVKTVEPPEVIVTDIVDDNV